MSGDDPFAEPGDTEKTVVNLRPGGRAPARPGAPAAPAPPPPRAPQAPYDPYAQAPTPPPPAAPTAPPAQPSGAPAAARSGVDEAEFSTTGLNPLNAAAAPIFALIGRIRNRAQHTNPDALRGAVVREVQQFENRALQAGVHARNVNIARYALCATIDDVVLNTPWGGRSIWTQQSMVGTFHKETHGGDRFYDVLAKLEQDPANNLELLEFIYVCLSLGFEGRLRVEHQGTDKHLRIREGLARLIRANRGQAERALSPMWKGLKLGHKVLRAWLSVWVIAGVLAVVLSLAFTGLTFALSGDTERVQGQLATLGSSQEVELLRRAPPPPPPPPPPATVDQVGRVSEFLEAEIAEGIVEVFQTGNTLTIRIASEGAGLAMFGPGSDELQSEYLPKIQRVAEALNNEEGTLIIAGHSDSVPISTARFPNNTVLSLKRAEAVMAYMATILDIPGRMSAEGRAESEPIADNGTREGRAKNRRVEVILVR
ncbi:type IVB secretion system protein IcmH/DotU [Abyssibius alkaniclasticus]|uniref:type IVB secretion system protein IcmH/DotU n=2 Tax=Abyssibius alkaniclasticus TaxID=2881234 RepID=UPI00236369DD|nr:type IVB secretion system protein IcmH/DotU [Abyssibius alkaniclasticus]UPH72395.1 type IVB secretion system protein IcmH/DotU [Abyssibius alkaniclasticus]